MSKRGKIRVKWDKKENDLMIYYPSVWDGHMIHGFLYHAQDLGKTLRQALVERGYDMTTFKLEVQRLPERHDG